MKDLTGHPRYYTINLSEILLLRQPEPALKLRLLFYEIRAIHSKQHWAIPYIERPQPKCVFFLIWAILSSVSGFINKKALRIEKM